MIHWKRREYRCLNEAAKNCCESALTNVWRRARSSIWNPGTNKAGRSFRTSIICRIYLKIEHKFTPREVNDLLKFKDPLNVAMNCWEENPDRFCFDISCILRETKAFEHFPLAQSEKTPKEKISIREQLNEAKRTVQQQLKSGKHISNDAHSR